jgi:hypothetical protein
MDEETLTVWLDTALLMLGGFILMTVLMLSVVNPPAQSAETNGEQSPGNVIIEAQWGDGLDADVDLWVAAPGDRPVGYSNKAGVVFNLLRDDLGKAQDVTDYNYEVAYGPEHRPSGETVQSKETNMTILEIAALSRLIMATEDAFAHRSVPPRNGIDGQSCRIQCNWRSSIEPCAVLCEGRPLLL